eukprot:CAMPEP_0194729716 /NCGR_PEP_ID=MMETSP0296-20130528/48915_1 /TAXON_ID=39354 /ORGANISM="Heterosigma akashiwo, Strain CCMP2393" /LENGTH=144 /DNA_ID=CAMNT_0039636403 /DNA_START=39 /DNA_END=470 /DNA_ORIENTATION=+
MVKKVIVIGAGILGSSIALNLYNTNSEEELDVCVLEAESEDKGPGAGGATSKSWAWLNANRKTPRHYKELNAAALRLWRLAPEAAFPGTLVLTALPDAELRVFRDPSYKGDFISNEEAESLEPNLGPGLDHLKKVFIPHEGLVD